MDIKLLQSFLISANRAGYSTGDTRAWVKEKDGSTTITYTEGPLTFHDNFFGGELFGGRMVIFQAEKPKWMMVYYGALLTKTDAGPVFQLLRSALQQMPEAIPLRGPSHFENSGMVYENQWNGDLERFDGFEKISISSQIIYRGFYSGGKL